MKITRFRRNFRRGLLLPVIAGLVLGGAGFVIISRDGVPSLAGIQASAQDAGQGIRVRVIDGDTIEDTTSGERIRLSNIDTPETGERAQCRAEREAGEVATRAAREIVASGAVTVRRTGRTDRYGRTIGFVLVDGRDLGEIMMDRGLARPWRGRREAWCAADGSLLPAH